MKKNAFLGLMGIVLTLLISSCSLPSQSFDEEKTKTQADFIQEKSNYFVKEENDTFVFEINSHKYSGVDGSTYFRIFNDEKNGENLPYRAKVVKNSGHSEYGYGVIFNYTKGSDDGEYKMLCVMINNDGQFCIGKVINGIYEDILYWQKNSSLKTGMGNENKIEVSYNEIKLQYEIIFNDVESEKVTFKDDKQIEQSGAIGIVATVSPNENFPTVPVNVKYVIDSVIF